MLIISYNCWLDHPFYAFIPLVGKRFFCFIFLKLDLPVQSESKSCEGSRPYIWSKSMNESTASLFLHVWPILVMYHHAVTYVCHSKVKAISVRIHEAEEFGVEWQCKIRSLEIAYLCFKRCQMRKLKGRMLFFFFFLHIS